MKNLLSLITLLLVFTTCSSQKRPLSHNIRYNSEVYSLDITDNNQYHSIYIQRSKDSLKLKGKIRPSLNDIFDSFLFTTKNETTSITFRKSEKNKYAVEQIDFLHSDGRNTSIHSYSDSQIGLDLSKYQIEIEECENCKDLISIIVQSSKW